MEIHFQQNQITNNMNSIPLNKVPKFKGERKSSKGKNKFVGVRQRPSGRWVAEIKDTTQKIRMWLGTFETPEAAARAYDEAACLLRGSNTRTNFIDTHVSPNSPIAYRIKNLLKNKKVESQKSNVFNNNVAIKPTKTCTTLSPSSTNNAFSCRNSLLFPNSSGNNVNLLTSNFVHGNASNYFKDQTRVYGDVNKPELSGFVGFNDQLRAHSSYQYGILDNCDIKPELDNLTLGQEMLEIMPKDEVISALMADESSEFQMLLMEKEMMISTSFYAGNNGVQEHDFFHDPIGTLWDFSPLCPSFCSF